VRRFLEDDDGRPERRERHVQTAAAGQGPELRGEVLQVGPRGVAQELEHVVVEALGPRAIDHDIGHGQDLEEEGVEKYRSQVVSPYGNAESAS